MPCAQANLLRPQAALGEHLVKLCIGRICLRHWLKKLRRKVKFAFAVVAQPEQGLGLNVCWIGGQHRAKCSCRGGEGALFELGQSLD